MMVTQLYPWLLWLCTALISGLPVNADQICSFGDIRLRGGANSSEGRVEICHDNHWGTVCDDEWGSVDANVACRQLGFSPTGATAVSRALFGQGTGVILLDNVRCTGSETRLVDCPSNGIGIHNCAHIEDAGIICEMCRFGDIRLRGGANSSEGRVEICYDDNQWGTVCDDEWGSADANVACRQLGFSPTGATAVSLALFGQGTGAILLDDVRCTGSETRLVDCPSTSNHNCIHAEDAGIICESKQFCFPNCCV